MANRKVKYVLEVDYDGEGAAARAAEDLRGVDEAAAESSEGLNLSAQALDKVKTGLIGLGALGMLKEGFELAGKAAQFFYGEISEGADLQMQQEQFAALAESIGSTAHALEFDLNAAVGGLMTTSEMMAGAGQMMSLGLAETHDEAVQLTEISAKLNWDLNVLGLTIANQSTARLDSLGLSIESVKGKMAGLQELGMGTDEAFKWALIEAGREKIELVGDVSDTAAGKLQMVETVVRGTQEAFALGAAEGFADTLGAIATTAPAAADALALASRGASNFMASTVGTYGLMYFSEELAWLVERGRELEETERRQGAALDIVTQGRKDAAEMAHVYARAQGAVNEVVSYGVYQGEVGRVAAQEYAEAQEWLARATDWVADAQSRARAADYARSQELQAQAAALQLINDAQAEWVQYTSEMTSWGGDMFTMFSQSDEAWNFAEAVYAAADAAGAGAGPLGDLAVDLGLVKEGIADAATAAVASETIANSLAEAAVAGIIPWENYAAAVQHAIDVYNGAALVELGPRSAPEMEDRGFREGYQEALAPVVNQMAPVELEVQLERESIMAAVDEARGVVEGFAETPFEAAVTMNIDDVIEKGGEVERIIESIPDYKHVQVDFTATGLEFLQELREAGVLP